MPEKDRYRITDDLGANWAFQQLAEKEKERAEAIKKYKGFVAQNEEYRERIVGMVDRDIEYFQGLINEYRETLEDKKVRVPSGQTITTKSKKMNYDEELLLKTVQSKYPQFVKSKQVVVKDELKKTLTPVNGHWVDENGEIVEGMSYEDKETVSFKTNDLEV